MHRLFDTPEDFAFTNGFVAGFCADLVCLALLGCLVVGVLA